MKKLLVALCAVGLTVSAFGQGQIISQNSASTAITNLMTGQRAVVSTMVGFYANPNAGAAAGDAGWVLAGGTTNLFSPGIFLGGTRTYSGFAAGTPAAVQVRAWLTAGSFSSYEAAMAGEPGGAFGQSIVMQITPQVAPTPIPTMTAAGLQPFTIIGNVPEPSSIALGLLGLGAIALFRRRK